jgi:hypothetical protein
MSCEGCQVPVINARIRVLSAEVSRRSGDIGHGLTDPQEKDILKVASRASRELTGATAELDAAWPKDCPTPGCMG